MNAAFASTAPFLLFDYFRVPYRVVAAARPDHLHVCRPVADEPRPALYWPPADGEPGPLHLRELTFHGRVVPDEIAAKWLRSIGSGWAPAEPIRAASGEHMASVWRSANGDLFLPFDPSAAILSFWSERYDTGATRRTKRALLRGYYTARPFLPRRLQIALRRLLARVQARRRFPRWPLETSLHDLYDVLFDYLAELADGPVPAISPWPRGYSWAFVLTHDVETGCGYRELGALRALERSLGYRSAWNFVPKRYDVEDEVVSALLDEGFEVGVHGLYHDGRDLESRATLTARLPEIERHKKRWGAVGFRSPATHRDWELMPLLPFTYDSSSPDSDPFEPRSGGCCSLLPFQIDRLVELPITLAQDHTLFEILRRVDASLWLEKSAEIRRRGGLALVITHPDYMAAPERLAAYRSLLATYAEDETAWRALPRDVADWWNRRAASRLEASDTGWDVVGPAADDASVAWYGNAASLERRALAGEAA
jgi:hypothetical protein